MLSVYSKNKGIDLAVPTVCRGLYVFIGLKTLGEAFLVERSKLVTQTHL